MRQYVRGLKSDAMTMSRFRGPFVGLFLALAVLLPPPALAGTEAEGSGMMGRVAVKGLVTDESGQAIPGVTVTISRAGSPNPPAVVITEGDGSYRVEDLTPGTHRVEASLDGFQPLSREVKLGTGSVLDVRFQLVPAFSETVEVVGENVQVGEVAILESRRQAPVVSDSISAEEIRRTPDSNAAGVVERLTGVTLIGDKYVYVRGLGERYSGSTVNGSILPTTETEKRVVPLDLFPAKLLDSVNVVKTYTPDRPGDFGSGIVEMTTVEFPRDTTLKLGFGTSYVEGVTGRQFRQYAGGLSRWGGGGQRMPAGVPKELLQRSSPLSPEGFTAGELEAIGEKFLGSWTGESIESATPGTDLSLTFGTTVGRLGIVLSGVSSSGVEEVDEDLRFFGFGVGDELVAYNDYRLSTFRESATTGLVGNLSYRLNDTNRLYLNSILTRDAGAEDRVQEGVQAASGGNIRDFRVRYQVEEVRSTRLRGEHNLAGPALGGLLEWNVSTSTATNDSDLRENIYGEVQPGQYLMLTGQAASGRLEYFGLEDDIRQGGMSYSAFFARADGSVSGSIEGGMSRLDRTRDFSARRFRFFGANLEGIDLTATPDQIYTADTIGPDAFEIREITGVNDAYDATHLIDAAYVMSDTTFGKWRVIGGARYELSEQSVSTFDPFDVANVVESVRRNDDLLPSLNVVYQLASRTNLRFAYGRSLNRPEFRELSPFAFTEVAGGQSVAGNPALEQATIDGLDVRWESFPGEGEVVAFSTFYKKIDKPIERIIQPTSDYRRSFVNAESATLWGVELEFRRSLEMVAPLLRAWSLNTNFAFIKSDVTVGEHQLSTVTSTERPLEGQSDIVANLALQYYKPEWGTMLRLMGAYTGERLADVGARGLPDVYEQPFTSVDFVLSQDLGPFARGVEVKLAGSNLLDEKREYLQNSQVQRLYGSGRKFSLSFSYTPF